MNVRRFVTLIPALVLINLSGCSWLASSHNSTGVRHYTSGNLHGATNEFQKAIADEPTNADAYYNLASVYHVQGRDQKNASLLTQAEQLYRQAIQYDKDHVHAYRGLAVVMSQTGRQQEAIQLLKGWAASSPANSEARVELARIHEETGDLNTAQTQLMEALTLDSKNSRAWAALGKIREQQGQPAQALQNYAQAYRSNQMQPGVSNRIAALNQSVSGQGGTTSGDTRMVNISVPPPTTTR